MANSFSVYYFESPETAHLYLPFHFKGFILSFGLISPCQSHVYAVKNKQTKPQTCWYKHGNVILIETAIKRFNFSINHLWLWRLQSCMVLLGVSDTSVVIRVNHDFIIITLKYLIAANIRPYKHKKNTVYVIYSSFHFPIW